MELKAAEPQHWVFRQPWLAAALLYLPMAAVFLTHLLGSPAELWPTGFLQDDQPGYMATAMQHFERGFTLFYSLPYSADPASPAIYFQPFNLLLGFLQWVSDADPGRLYLAAGAVCGVLFLRLAIALYGHFVTGRDRAAALGLLLFCWGGGLFVVATLALGLLKGQPDLDVFLFDPLQGYWFLNLGRNLFYPTEAFYHLVVFALLLALLRRRFGLALALLALTAISHPFTGLQFLAVATAALCAQRWLWRDRTVPPWAPLGALALLALHFFYYLWLMPRLSPEHAVLMSQWHVAWVMALRQMALAYGLVGFFAPLATAQQWRQRRLLAEWRTRLCLIWLLVSLVLAKHDLFTTPTQPLHFTRGYIWAPLFLLGAEPLVALLRRLLSRRRAAAWTAAIILSCLFLLDNAVWLTRTAIESTAPLRAVSHLGPEERRLLTSLREPRLVDHLVVPVDDDYALAYLAVTYTPLRAWRSHIYNTPWSEQRLEEIRAFQATGAEPPAWQGRPLLIIVAGDAAVARSAPWFDGSDRILTTGPVLTLVERVAEP